MWWLNPWREVRRLRDACDGLNQNWCDTLALLEECANENAYLRKVVESQSEWSPCDPVLLDEFLGAIRKRKEELGITDPDVLPDASGMATQNPVDF